MPFSCSTSENLNSGWVYHPGPDAGTMERALKLKDAEPVVLPHSWNTKDTFQTDVSYRLGMGSYYRNMTVEEPLEETSHRWMLCSDGFFGLGSLRINGKKVFEFDAQYLGFEFDLTPFLSWSKSLELCITVSNRPKARVLPGIKDPDFLLYGGLAANLWIEKRPRIQLPGNSIHASCEWQGDAPDLQIEFELENTSDIEWRGQVRWTLAQVEGAGVVEIAVRPGERGKGECRLKRLSDIQRWSLDHPVLYTLTGEVLEGEDVIQQVEIQVGFREIGFDDQGRFRLNGEGVEIRGCNRHECMPGFGNAMPEALHVQDAEIIKSMGLNAVRLSHYPQNPAFLDACDRLGILVYAEIASWKTVKTGAWLKAACRQVEGMIRRDRNHPSIILWGLGNESRSAKAFAAMTDVVRSLDPERFTIYAENHLYRAKRKKTLQSVDVWGCNYELDLLEELGSHSKTGAVVVSECSNQPHALRGNLEEEIKQIEQLDRDLNRIESSGAAGYFIWSFQDYATLRKKRYARYCGLVDAWRQPKLVAAYLTARLSHSLYVKGFIRSSSLWIFTNGSDLEITTESDSVKVPSSGFFYQHPISEPFSPITVRVHRDQEMVTEVIVPGGPAEALVLEPSRIGGSLLAIDLSVVDGAGRVVSDWEGQVAVKGRGPVRLFPYTIDGTVWVTAGTGRFYVEFVAGGESASLYASFEEGCLEQSLRLT